MAPDVVIDPHADTVRPLDTLSRFVRALMPTDTGVLELRAFPSKTQRFFAVDDLAGIRAFLDAHAHEDTYHGCASRRSPTTGTLENCHEQHVLWVDIDFKTTPEADARMRLGTFPIPPHLVIASGGGLHLYWRLREPFQLPADAPTSKAWLRRLALYFGGDLSSAEPARVLRPPTTRNHKYDPPRDVALEHVEDDALDVSELDEWLPPEPARPNGSTGDPSFSVPARIVDGERNSLLYRTARSMHAKHFSAAAIRAALHAENVAKCDPRLPPEEVDAIATHAATQPDRENFAADTLSVDDIQVASPLPPRLDTATLEDAPLVIAEGQRIAATEVPYLVEGLIPAYGELGMNVAYAKVGKTTFGQHLGAAVATGRPFLDRATHQTRVLMLAPEDPREYTAWLARHLDVPPGVLTFWRAPLRLDPAGLAAIVGTVQADGYGFVLIASWQAVVRGLIKDENDNAGAVRIVEDVKAATRATGIPWLIDAHSGKGEDQTDDADPSKAMRGASGAAGAADYTLSLRYSNGPFGAHRRLSGKGRFVSFAPVLLSYDLETGAYTVLGTNKAAAAETTWRLLCETGALSTTPQSVDAIARRAGLVNPNDQVTGTGRRQVRDALSHREGVRMTTETRRGKDTTLYAFQEAL